MNRFEGKELVGLDVRTMKAGEIRDLCNEVISKGQELSEITGGLCDLEIIDGIVRIMVDNKPQIN